MSKKKQLRPILETNIANRQRPSSIWSGVALLSSDANSSYYCTRTFTIISLLSLLFTNTLATNSSNGNTNNNYNSNNNSNITIINVINESQNLLFIIIDTVNSPRPACCCSVSSSVSPAHYLRLKTNFIHCLLLHLHLHLPLSPSF